MWELWSKGQSEGDVMLGADLIYQRKALTEEDLDRMGYGKGL